MRLPVGKRFAPIPSADVVASAGASAEGSEASHQYINISEGRLLLGMCAGLGEEDLAEQGVGS